MLLIARELAQRMNWLSGNFFEYAFFPELGIDQILENELIKTDDPMTLFNDYWRNIGTFKGISKAFNLSRFLNRK